MSKKDTDTSSNKKVEVPASFRQLLGQPFPSKTKKYKKGDAEKSTGGKEKYQASRSEQARARKKAKREREEANRCDAAARGLKEEIWIDTPRGALKIVGFDWDKGKVIGRNNLTRFSFKFEDVKIRTEPPPAYENTTH